MDGHNPLPHSYYASEDVLWLAKNLLGKKLCTHIGGVLTTSIIVETEAYNGETDKASHAHLGRFTERTKIMYEAGGVAYVYLCYGIHHLFNIITAPQGIPHAVLIRGVQPLEGIDTMLQRRGLNKVARNLTGGPGLLTQALGITILHNGTDLTADVIWIESGGMEVDGDDILASPRVGVGYAQEDALLPWRFRIKGSGFSSSAK